MEKLWKYKKIGEVCIVERGASPRPIDKYITDNESGINWIKIGDTSDSMYITETAQKIIVEGMKKSRYVKPGDFLLSNSMSFGRPYILKIDGCIHDGWLVLRDENALFDKRFLYYYLSSKTTYKKLKSMAVGGVVNNLNSEMVRNVIVPVPDKEEQSEIADLFDKIKKILDDRKQELEQLDTLVKSRFVELFGNPISNSYGLPEATLPELGEFGRGVSKHRPRNDPRLLDGEYPLIQTGDIANTDLYITLYNSTYSELGLQQSKMWNKGTLCITIAANIAKTAILRFDACFPDSVVGFNANERTNNIFIHYWFSFFQSILESQAPESAQKNINLKILSELKVIVPKKEKQDEFVEFINQLDKSKSKIQKSLEETQRLFDSLMQKYFG